MATAPSNAIEITQIGFRPPADARLDVEALTIEHLRQRAPPEHFKKLQRADFYRLIGVTGGVTRSMVDFADYPAQAGDWLLVRPGQVFRYDFSRPWAGWLLVFRPESLPQPGRSRTGDEPGLLPTLEDLACLRSLDAAQHGWMARSLQQLQADGALAVDLPLRKELMRLQLAGTLLRLAMWQAPGGGGLLQGAAEQGHFRRFRQRLDADFATRHQVQHYASALALGEKTLSRVCLAATGLPAKALINQRLLLEARRLLAHTTAPVQAIGRELGFDEPTNFVKFFRKEAGVTPLAFRREVAGVGE